jgi:hypothetical protein
MMTEYNNTRLSKSVLHDEIKSIINYYPEEILSICKTIPKIKDSNIVKGDHWKFIQSRQEQINNRWRQADVVWFFSDDKDNPFYIVHEVKTGLFDIEDIYRKYHTGMTVHIWIWAFNKNIKEANQKNTHVSVRVIPIDFIVPLIIDVKENHNLILKELIAA